MDASGNYLDGTYSVTRLVTIPKGSHTLTMDSFTFDGTTTCTAYGNALTATLVGSAAGAIKAASRSTGATRAHIGPPR